MAWMLEAEIAWNEGNPFRQHLGVAVESVQTDGRTEIAIAVTENLPQAYGMVHGGIYCVIDTAMGSSGRAGCQCDAKPLTTDRT
jgi:1,4-dihydroxy-2-naphthoyl-CoA hydrolase